MEKRNFNPIIKKPPSQVSCSVPYVSIKQERYKSDSAGDVTEDADPEGGGHCTLLHKLLSLSHDHGKYCLIGFEMDGLLIGSLLREANEI